MKNFRTRLALDLAALAIFAALACIYCAPSLQGKIVNAGDTSNYKGSVHEVAQYQKESGETSFWTGSMFCGMPTYQIGATKYKSNTLLKPLRSVAMAGHAENRTPLIILLYFVCFYILLRCFNVGLWMSVVGAVAVALSSYFILIIPAGHITKTSTIAIMSVAIGGFRLIYDRKYLAGAILTAVPVAVCFTGHPQMSYYICMFIGLLFLAELAIHVREKRLRDFAISTIIFAASFAVGFGANATSYLANREYVTQTMRGGHSDISHDNDNVNKTSGLDLDYATEWSYGIDESLSFLIPGIKGGASTVALKPDSKLYRSMVSKGVDRSSAAQFCQNTPMYWGDQRFTAGNVYMGAAVCFLFVLGLIVVKGPYKWAIAAATLLSMALAWGHNFMSLTAFFFKFFPMYSKFRAVSSILIVAEIAMPLLGFMAIRDIMNGTVGKAKAISGILTAAGITAGICLFFALFGKSMFSFTGVSDAAYSEQLPDFIYNGIIVERQALLVRDSLRSAFFIICAAAVVFIYVKGWIRGWLVTALLGIIVLVDMWQVDRRYFNENNYISPKQSAGRFEMQPYEKQILTDKDPHFRVLNLTTSTFNDSRTSYYLKSLGGYHAAKLRRYQDLIDQHLSRMNMNVISMLNAKYIITQGENGQPAPLRNTAAMGNAWYVDSLLVVNNADQECEAIGMIDLHTTAVIGNDFSEYADKAVRRHDDNAFVRLTDYAPNHIDYECSSIEDGTVVFSEIYYPFGWKATIDGTPVEHFRANYALRALNVPAGQHRIRFEFIPDFKTGDAISTVCIILIYATIIAAIALPFTRRRKDGMSHSSGI